MAGPASHLSLTASAPAVAFVGHLPSLGEYRVFLSAMRGADLPPLSEDRLAPLLRRLDPMPVCDFVLRSPMGGALPARYIDAFLIVDAQWQMATAVGRVHAACAVAARTGARLVALGGFSSIVGESARLDPSREFGVPFTTGNTLTAAVVAEQALTAAEGDTHHRVTVLGAGGDVGSGVCRILHARGFTPALVGRRPAPLAALASELPGTAVCSWEDAAPRSDIVVLVSSATLGAVSLERVSRSAVVLDAGHPPNGANAPGVRYARAGRVRLSCPLETDLPALLRHYEPGEVHACLAEGMTLALESRWEAYSVGRGGITPVRAAEILALAARHGIGSAPPHWEGSSLSRLA
jgi:fatty aldehyde-generating acyl-ACP reductase